MAPLGSEGFRLATGVSRETLARLACYAALLEKWSGSMNLVGRRTLADLWRRHMLDSAQLLDLLPGAPKGRPRVLLDLGSGAGFPGLVLAILGAGQVHLVEADRKKAVFLREAARVSGTEVEVHAARIEDLTPFKIDIVTARALAPMPALLDLAAAFLCPHAPGGIEPNPGPNPEANTEPNGSANTRSVRSLDQAPVALFLKGRGAERELTDSGKMWKMRTEVFPSRSDPGGRIIRLSGLARKQKWP